MMFLTAFPEMRILFGLIPFKTGSMKLGTAENITNLLLLFAVGGNHLLASLFHSTQWKLELTETISTRKVEKMNKGVENIYPLILHQGSYTLL